MTDRLSALLHDGADGIDVPPMPDVVASGRREVRRRRTRTALVGAVAAVLVVAGATVAVDRWRDSDDSIQPADELAYQQRGAWVSDEVVHIGDHSVEVPGAQFIVYSSEGAIVGSLPDSIDEPTTFTLVRPDGQTRDLGHLGSITAAADSAEVIYADLVDEPDQYQLTVLDLRSGDTETLGEPFRAQSAPPIDRSGQYLVTHRGNRMVMVDLETGEMDGLPQEEIGFTTFSSFGPAGYITAPEPEQTPITITEWHVRSMPDGDLVGSYPDAGGQYATVSPDGRYLLTSSDTTAFVYDVATGERLPLELTPPDGYRTGWTPDGHVLTVGDQGTVEVCEPVTGACTDSGESAGESVRLAGGSFNSWS